MANESDSIEKSLPRAGLSPELQDILAFTERENQKHRDYFQTLYKQTAGALTVIVVVVGVLVTFVGWHTIDDIKKQAQTATSEEIEGIRKQSKEALEKQTVEIQQQIAARLNDEFRTESIRQTIEAAAKQQTAGALLPIITHEVRTQVTAGVKLEQTNVQQSLLREVHQSVDDLKPTINKRVDDSVSQSVNAAVSSQVDSQIAPRLKQLENSAQISTLINQAESGDAPSFDILVRMAGDPGVPPNSRDLALKVARSIVSTNNTGLYASRTFTTGPSQEQMVGFLKDPDAYTRQAAIDTLPINYWKTQLDELFSVMTSDPNLKVRVSAYNRFKQITQIKADALDNLTVIQWWTLHRKEFVK